MIHACCVLHNMANARDLEFLEPPIDDEYPDLEAQGAQNVEQNELHREYESGVHFRNEICRQISE